MPSYKEIKRYRATWAEVLDAQGWAHESPEQKDERRRDLHAELKLPHSSTEFTNRDFNTFYRACDRLRGQRKSRDRNRENLIWRINTDAKQASLDESYIEKVSTDLYGLACWRELALDDLENLRNVIHNRAAGKKRKYRMDSVPRSFKPEPAGNPF
jgi:hypothetical protein